jgi:two-component system NtrC family sensor kinase
MSGDLTSFNRRILIVDDNPAIHEDFTKILAPQTGGDDALDELNSLMFGNEVAEKGHPDFELEHALQGQEALQKVETAIAEGRPFSMAFVDVRMPPGWDGIETISRIWEVAPGIQIVICTAYSDYNWSEITEKLGRSDNLLILKKPFDQVEALQLAHSLTNKWNFARQARIHTNDLERLVAERTADLEASHEQRRQAAKMEAVGRLAAGVAHDFNNLMTVILGYASIELYDAPPNSSSVQSLKFILSAGERAAGLTRQLLAFSRKQVLHPKPLNLNDRLAEMGPILRPLAGANIDLRLDLAPSLPHILADPTNLDQIILNLTLNARDAMSRGGQIVISTALHAVPQEDIPATADDAKAGPYFCITVSDTGKGMDPETAERLFEPFFTTKEVGRGTGMGLATVQGIVAQHNGWIEVETALNIGTSFHVYLPSHADPAAGLDCEAVPTPFSASSGTVLIAEDEEGVKLLAQSTFESHGFKVLAACTAGEALQMWEANSDDIVLFFTDMVMPGPMSGFDAAQIILQSRPDLPVIFSSGYSLDLLTSGLDLKEGANYLAKPYRPTELSALINSIFSVPPLAELQCGVA